MSEFFRFPHTPHLVWLGDGMPRDDKVLSLVEAKTMLADEVVVEEKLDGANLGFSLSLDEGLLAQSRSQYLTEPYAGQFARLPAWLSLHGDAVLDVLKPHLMLFGEWCAARHSLDYNALPDWFLLFDVYDRAAQRFWSTARRDVLAQATGLTIVPRICQGYMSLTELKQLVFDTPSRYRVGSLEGIVVRRESGDWCEMRAKLVRPDFTQTIDTHWRKRAIEWNRMIFENARTKHESAVPHPH
jgi:ATP-dependent RNA circularization protein (DNA/RNA ligase family)